MNGVLSSKSVFTSFPKVQKYKCYWLTASSMTHVKDTFLGHKNIGCVGDGGQRLMIMEYLWGNDAHRRNTIKNYDYCLVFPSSQVFCLVWTLLFCFVLPYLVDTLKR